LKYKLLPPSLPAPHSVFSAAKSVAFAASAPLPLLLIALPSPSQSLKAHTGSGTESAAMTAKVAAMSNVGRWRLLDMISPIHSS
jgi:hypothetical protein